MTRAKMKNQGLQVHRLKPERDNPEEVLFAKAWEHQNKYGHVLAHLLNTDDSGSRPPDPPARDVAATATVIQWLGSPVGQSFLRDIGYKKGTRP